jgi:MlaC protein
MLSCPVHAAPAGSSNTVRAPLRRAARHDEERPDARSERAVHAARAGLPAELRPGDDGALVGRAVLAQRQQVTESFGRYISAIYADRFDSYAGQKLEVTGEQPNPGGVMVTSQIVKADGEPVKADYLMRRNGEGWLISNIYLDGAISEVTTRRSEFGAIIRTQGVDGLIARSTARPTS